MDEWQPTLVALLLSSLGPLERSLKLPGFKWLKNLWFHRLLHPVATNARWHRKWSTDIAELTEQHFVGNTCLPRLPNPNAGKVTCQKISSIPPQSNLPLVSSWVLFATTKACARFKKSESFLKGIFRSTRFSVVHGFKLTWLFSCCQEIHAHAAVQDNSKKPIRVGIGVVAVVDCLPKYLKFHRGWWCICWNQSVTDTRPGFCSPCRARSLYRLCSFCRFYHYSYTPEVPKKKLRNVSKKAAIWGKMSDSIGLIFSNLRGVEGRWKQWKSHGASTAGILPANQLSVLT